MDLLSQRDFVGAGWSKMRLVGLSHMSGSCSISVGIILYS
jgi:hypothetical protein